MDRKNFLRGAAAMLGGGTLAATPRPARAEGAGDSRFDMARDRGHLIVSTMTTIPPFASKDDTGKLVGFDVDIAKLAAKALFNDDGKIEFLGVSGDGRWPAALTGQADFGLATTYMSRANIVAFTDPYMDTSITLLASRRAGLKTLADVNKSSVTVANLNNPQMADRAKQFFPDAQLGVYDGISAQFLALRSGRAQAMQIDTPVAEFFAARNKDEVVVLDARLGDVFGNGLYLTQSDPKWLYWLNTFVRELKSGSMYSDYAKTFNTWFGKDPPAERFYAA